MNQPLQLLIVDDEPLAHQVLLHHLAADPDVQVVAQCYNAAEALAVLAHQPIDLMLLDIQMPVLTGLDMLKVLATPPQVIITSAYAEYALDGFALDVTDYLLKPISAGRLQQALEKVRRRQLARTLLAAGAQPELPQALYPIAAPTSTSTPTAPQPAAACFIVLKVERELRKFELARISCFEAYGNYVKVWQSGQMTLVNSTLKQIHSQCENAGFVQVHKSFLVNKQQVIALDSHKVQLADRLQIKIGEAYKDNARSILAGR
ncbi:response regulator [Rheinheimera riviphila]|uniref:Response regulator n=1 Tax=Rheinheimera riviphila TaxID=1834037 RepID=A0A437R051_9GAMM|nr:response regulator [Rheinheimera riviphila]RVU40154.1 response regulator [Rheinheimera riviphila]